ncbi:TIGR04211 family SH3 domain-containing protein [Thiohalobacter sp. IOR34]|uniref:TIGR04211 family SH3 domain-containing protein n=1 Tax=Thiohalobacter sp. IOR34 TaxID=3057176 RepID=UPI0025B176F4|nr:TIGR04211 family SH3 domain-containing protein [Thiohalobacter sp. IOR34]WJW75167.1 TIGR04211 family SH3 domain-containing protein [Thiohalobacter sp. IOR34]
MKRLLVFALLLGLALPAFSETRFVSDRLEIPMRTGKSMQHRISRMLPSGTPVEVLEVDKASGWSLVRAPSGAEGWVLSRYLMKVPAARDRLVQAEKKLAQLEMQDKTRGSRLAELEEAKAAVEAELAKLKAENSRLAQQLAEVRRTASSTLAIDSENRELKNKLIAMEREQQTLVQENESLRDRTARDWFMVGAGVIIVGIILGLILPRIRFRKRSSWDTL